VGTLRGAPPGRPNAARVAGGRRTAGL
jgi:hypothetical protein